MATGTQPESTIFMTFADHNAASTRANGKTTASVANQFQRQTLRVSRLPMWSPKIIAELAPTFGRIRPDMFGARPILQNSGDNARARPRYEKYGPLLANIGPTVAETAPHMVDSGIHDADSDRMWPNSVLFSSVPADEVRSSNVGRTRMLDDNTSSNGRGGCGWESGWSPAGSQSASARPDWLNQQGGRFRSLRWVAGREGGRAVFDFEVFAGLNVPPRRRGFVSHELLLQGPRGLRRCRPTTRPISAKGRN